MAMGRIALACEANGIACFDRIRHRRNDETVFLLYAGSCRDSSAI